MANPQRILTYLTASKDVLMQEKLTVTGQTNLNGNVNLGDSSADVVTAAAQITASNGLNIVNGLTSVGGASVGGIVNFTQTGTDAFAFAGSGSIEGKLLVKGGLQVQGDIDYLNTTNLNILDQKITIARGATDLNGDPGLYVASDSNPFAQISIRQSDKVWYISGSDAKGYGGLVVQATSSVDFGNIQGGLVANSEYNIEKVFRAIDTKFASTTTVATVRTEYDKLRFLTTGSITNASPVTVSLNKAAFANANKNFITLDVMVRDDINNPWTNDLVSVYMQTGSTYVDVTIDAPGVGASGWEYKLIAINENTGSLGVI